MSEPNFSQMSERILVPSLFRPWAKDLLERVRFAQADRVLDLAGGTGIVARLAR
jgi:ubiquinone/menaquinone biosynthesis C-methylase UbiE